MELPIEEALVKEFNEVIDGHDLYSLVRLLEKVNEYTDLTYSIDVYEKSGVRTRMKIMRTSLIRKIRTEVGRLNLIKIRPNSL